MQSRRSTVLTEPEYKQWLQRLQSFILSLLAHIIPDRTKRLSYITGPMMTIWAAAFTHETYSFDSNYEELEYLGDAVLKAQFPKYLIKRIPTLKKNNYSELNVYYMSKPQQAALSRSLKLGDYVLLRGLEKSILNIDTDLFESFFGALDSVSDSLVNGLGAANCYNMLVYLFDPIEIDLSKMHGSYKTQVIQIFMRFFLGAPDFYFDKDSNNFYVILTPKHINFLRSYNINIMGNIDNETFGGQFVGGAIIAIEYGNTKAVAEANAYEAAFNKLGEFGITREWAEEIKMQRDLEPENIKQLMPQVTAKMAIDKFTKIYFFTSRKTVTKTTAVIQLIGRTADGSNKTLETEVIQVGEDPNEDRAETLMAKERLLRRYISN